MIRVYPVPPGTKALAPWSLCIHDLKAAQKNGEITEDGLKDFEDEIQKLTDEYVKEIDEKIKTKEKEITTI